MMACVICVSNWEAGHCIACNSVGSTDQTQTQTIVNDAEYHTLIQQEQMALFDAF